MVGVAVKVTLVPTQKVLSASLDAMVTLGVQGVTGVIQTSSTPMASSLPVTSKSVHLIQKVDPDAIDRFLMVKLIFALCCNEPLAAVCPGLL